MSEINFYNVDCMDFMKTKPDNCYDLVIADPEYGINQGGDKNHTRGKLVKSKKYHSFNDNKSPEKIYFDELIRISKNQIIWGANHFISKIPYDSSCWIVWNKVNGANDFADCELAWTSFKTAVRKIDFMWHGFMQGSDYKGNMQGNKKLNEIRIHPTQKPVKLYQWILSNYAEKGMKILDTHGGSFSNAIACDLEGFDLDICEIDKEYFDAGVNRFEWHKKQLRLF